MSAEQRLQELGIVLPEPPTRTPAKFVDAVEYEGCLYVSGHGPTRDGEFVHRGRVDSVVSVDTARQAAELTIMNALVTVRTKLGSLDRVTQVLKVLGMVNSDPDFEGQPKVIDAASELLVQVFGDAGRHARSAVGVAALPYGLCVEIEIIFGIR